MDASKGEASSVFAFKTKRVVVEGASRVTTLEGEDFYVGDCWMDRSAKLTLHPDGTGMFVAKIRSNDDNDVWLHAFAFKNSAGQYHNFYIPMSKPIRRKIDRAREWVGINEPVTFPAGYLGVLATSDWHASARRRLEASDEEISRWANEFLEAIAKSGSSSR